MRISTSTYYSAALAGIQEQQARIARLSQQVAENKAYLSPKDAPLSANRAMDLSSSIAQRKQYLSNQDKAELSLKFESVQLSELNDTLGSALSVLMSSSSGQDQNLRDQAAIQLSNFYKMAKDIGNARDAQGNYIFAGHETATKPFAHSAIYPGSLPVSANATTYSGDFGVRNLAVEFGREVQSNDTLEDVFITQDLLGTMDYAAAALQDPSASAAAVDNAVAAAVSAINAAQDALQGIETRVAGRVLEISDLRGSTRTLLSTEEGTLAGLTEVDTAAAIIELQMRQTNLEASQRTYALVSGLSLFNFIS